MKILPRQHDLSPLGPETNRVCFGLLVKTKTTQPHFSTPGSLWITTTNLPED